MKVAIIGSRTADSSIVPLILKHLPADVTEIVSGGAAGVDTFAEEVAHSLSLPLRVFTPDYKTFGKTAPLQRNRQIIDYADLVLAFWDGQSRGTAFVVAECVKCGKPVRVFPLK
ncbi:MAG: hypothetical protein IKI63_06200 [Clostridia bacterium]|nr:hypothetical protein [Clostridia bacterium]